VDDVLNSLDIQGRDGCVDDLGYSVRLVGFVNGLYRLHLFVEGIASASDQIVRLSRSFQ
jgi:hypothetical protein